MGKQRLLYVVGFDNCLDKSNGAENQNILAVRKARELGGLNIELEGSDWTYLFNGQQAADDFFAYLQKHQQYFPETFKRDEFVLGFSFGK